LAGSIKLDRVPVTKQGFEALRNELQNLKKIERPENIRAIELKI
jgi:transcription elongation factor GreA